MRKRCACGLAIAGLVVAASQALAADVTYRAELSSYAHTLATRATVLGKGSVSATLSGKTLTVTGSYSGLPSEATKARLDAGLAVGVPGETFAELKVTGGTSGDISGSATLNPAQLKALRAGGISVVVETTKTAEGNLWGWLASPAR